MIITKTPLRMTLGGGGTDLPSYSSEYGGFLVTSALDKYVYLTAKRRFEKDLRISYSVTEIVNSIDSIQHPVIREALRLLDLKGHLEIVSMADFPAETGLGSSGSFTVGLLNALYALKGENCSSYDLARQASHLEMEILKEPCGPQDTYIAAFGGFECLEISRDGRVTVSPLKISEDVIRELEDNLVFFYTGIKRGSSVVLQDQQQSISKNKADTVEAMHQIKEIGFKVKKALERGDLSLFGKLQHEHWVAKKATSSGVSMSQIDNWYNLALKKGALGGKIMGAGGGGFLALYCDNGKDKLRKALTKEGLTPVNFKFEKSGSKVMINL